MMPFRESPCWRLHIGNVNRAPLRQWGELCLVATDKALLAVAWATGRLKWRYDWASSYLGGLTISDDRLFLTLSTQDLVRGRGFIVALNRKGEQCWRWQKGLALSDPTLLHDQLWVSSDTDQLHRLSQATGTVHATLQLVAPTSFSAPLVTADSVYLPSNGPGMTAYTHEGAIRWQFEHHVRQQGWLQDTPLISGECLYLKSQHEILALDRRKGALMWRHEMEAGVKVRSSLLLDGGYCYVGTTRGLLKLDVEDGQKVWVLGLDRPVEATPLIVGEQIFVACHDHYLYTVNKQSGQIEYRIEVGQQRLTHSPLLIGPQQDLLIVACHDGTLSAFERQHRFSNLKAIDNAPHAGATTTSMILRRNQNIPLPERPALVQLIDQLSTLYIGREEAARVASHAGLELNRLPLEGSSIDRWYVIVMRAWRKDRLPNLMAVVESENPEISLPIIN